MKPKLILVIGGARSGKSRFANRLASRLSKRVTYIATCKPLDPVRNTKSYNKKNEISNRVDREMAQRIKQHKRLRAFLRWRTIEEPKDIVKVIRGLNPVRNTKNYNKKNKISNGVKDTDVILIDCLTLWVSNLLLEGLTEKEILSQARFLTKAIKCSSKDTIVVSNEVGMGIVPENRLGRQFRDIAGLVNQVLAEAADEVYLLISGLPVRLKG